MVGCVRGEELAGWDMVAEGVRNPLLFFKLSIIYGSIDFFFLLKSSMFSYTGEVGSTD